MPQKKSENDSSKSLTRGVYDASLPTLEALRQEVVFILENAILSQSIKIHTIESRVKTFDSLKKKLEDRSIGSIHDVTDTVGVRVVCLFKSNLGTLDNLISDQFHVVEKDNKVEVSTDSFGYMSVHYVCKMKGEYKGPRYNKIKDHIFEIQIRTLCMHAWAAISHYLDYKAEWDIPSHLRKGLNALSGLFYVADEQYEQLYNARQDSRNSANSISSKLTGGSPINLDTVSAFLGRKYNDRDHPTSDRMSILVRELLEGGYSSLESVENDLDRAKSVLEKEEERVKRDQGVKTDLYFNSMGAVRVILCSVNPKFKEAFDRSPLIDEGEDEDEDDEEI